MMNLTECLKRGEKDEGKRQKVSQKVETVQCDFLSAWAEGIGLFCKSWCKYQEISDGEDKGGYGKRWL